jgi:hypothetical protein
MKSLVCPPADKLKNHQQEMSPPKQKIPVVKNMVSDLFPHELDLMSGLNSQILKNSISRFFNNYIRLIQSNR